ncbi:MAG: nuclear transport factor 2 family protein [Actinomycetota bacterium]|nr:nuclear transport factor 2 family protein [Actinomycetota bacterium]
MNPHQERTMADLRKFFAAYAERYMASDVDAVAAMCEAPLLAVREGRAIHLGNRSAVQGHLAELMRAYRSTGAARADIAELDVVPLGNSGAVTTVRWHVVDEAGTLLRDFRTTYQLLRGDDGWRILSYTNHDA